MWENGKNCENHGCTVISGCITTMCIEIISQYGGGSFFVFFF